MSDWAYSAFFVIVMLAPVACYIGAPLAAGVAVKLVRRNRRPVVKMVAALIDDGEWAVQGYFGIGPSGVRLYTVAEDGFLTIGDQQIPLSWAEREYLHRAWRARQARDKAEAAELATYKLAQAIIAQHEQGANVVPLRSVK